MRLTASIQKTTFALLALTLFVSAQEAAAHPRVISIAQARSLPLGTVVTVDGSVTTPSGAFASSFFDQGFGLQDRSAGIYVSIQENLNVAPRRQARVTGTLAESFGLLILVPTDASDVKLHGAGPRVHPKFFPTGAISEATEGLLVTVVGTITEGPIDDLPFGYKVRMNDGSGETVVFINLETGIDVTPLTPGNRILVTGFSSQFAAEYEVDPRSPADILIQTP